MLLSVDNGRIICLSDEPESTISVNRGSAVCLKLTIISVGCLSVFRIVEVSLEYDGVDHFKPTISDRISTLGIQVLRAVYSVPVCMSTSRQFRL